MFTLALNRDLKRMKLARRFISDRSLLLFAAFSCADQIQRAVCAYPINPRPESSSPVEALELFVRAKKCLLNHILRILLIASHTKRQTEYGPAMPLHQDTKGMLIPLACLFGGR